MAASDVLDLSGRAELHREYPRNTTLYTVRASDKRLIRALERLGAVRQRDLDGGRVLYSLAPAGSN